MAQPQHAPLPAAPPLRLLSANVNGLQSNPDKRRALLGAFISGAWDVLCIQELHAASIQQVAVWAQEGTGMGMPFRGVYYVNPHTPASAGVAIFVKADAPITGSREVVAPVGGRLLDVVLSYAGQELSLINCYAPHTAAARPQFFEQDLAAVLPPDRPILVVGDWNFVGDPLDVLGQGLSQGRFRGSEQFDALAVQHGLVDAWRHLHPGQSAFTHVTHNGAGASAARLDRWYASATLLPWVRGCEMVEGLPGDHVGVSLTLAPEATLARGPGRWRFPLHLLQDKDYCTLVHTRTRLFLESHPLVPGQYSAGQRWEGLKSHLTHVTLAYDLEARGAEKLQHRQLLSIVTGAQRRYSRQPGVPGHLQAYELARQRLQEHGEGRAAQRAAAASVLWHCYGEQPTKWFHMLGKPLQPPQQMPGVRDPTHLQADPASMATAAGRETAKQRAVAFFSAASPVGLFRPPPTDPAAQEELLAAIDKTLSPSAALSTLGPLGNGSLTHTEVEELFPVLPRGVSPGNDGLPYEWYIHFWAGLGEAFICMANEALLAAADGVQHDMPVLPRSMLVGLIVLIYKGGGKDPCNLASYRPITLLNTDYRLLARVLCSRFASPLSSVIDVTQTAFLPGRWIGDNVLMHLEEVTYLHGRNQEACLVFLDFEKAYDRCERGWLYRCMARMGFPPIAVRWVQIMLAGTCARVSLNGHYTALFPVLSSLQQGSPLSALLYIITTQPLSAHLRLQQAHGAIEAILLPGGTPSPPSHMHADDTTLHMRKIADVALTLSPAGSVGLHCRASGAKLSPSKCLGMRFGPHPELDPATRMCGGCGVLFPPEQAPFKHLGIYLGRDSAAANTQTFGRLVHTVREAAVLWRQHPLSWLGRAYLAKQVLASMVTYHITFVPAPLHLWRIIASIVSAFVAGAASVDGEGGGRISHPALHKAALPWEEGGVGLVDMAIQADCLHAKVAARLLHPARHPWKLLMRQRLGAVLPALGAAVAVSSLQVTARTMPDPRLLVYMRGLQRTRPHRIVLPEALSPQQVGIERLFHNCQILSGGRPLQPQQHPSLVAAGVYTVGRLAEVMGAALQPPGALRVWGCVPEIWRGRASQPPTAGWLFDPAAQVVQQPGGMWYSVQGDGSLVAAEGALPMGLQWEPCCVVQCPLNPRDPESESLPFLVGAWPSVQVDPSVWGHGEKAIPAFTVKAAAARRVRLRAAKEGEGWYTLGAGWRPAVWDPPPNASGGSVRLSGLATLEARWALSYTRAGQAGSRQRAAEFAVQLLPCQQPGKRQRLGVHDRLAVRAALAASPSSPAALMGGRQDDVADAAAPMPPATVEEGEEQAAVRAAWRRLKLADLPREQYGTAYRLAHGSLYVGGFLCHIGVVGRTLACCSHPTCDSVLETLSHAFLSCPAVAPAAAWVCSVFGAVIGGPSPPVDAQLLLGDRRTAWQPPAGTEHLWTALRVAYVHSVWQLRNRRSLTGRAFTATATCAAVVAAIREAIQRDWARATNSLVRLSGSSPEWFRGRNTALALGMFKARWAVRSVLCTVVGGGEVPEGGGSNTEEPVQQPKLTFHFTLGHPVPAPVAPAASAPSTAQDSPPSQVDPG